MKANTKIGISAIGLAACATVFMLATNPQNLAPILLVVPFILFFFALLLAVVFITTIMAKSDSPRLTRKHFIFAVLAAGYPVMLLLLQSIAQLQARDVITLTLILVISSFYVSKAGFSD